MAATKKPTIPTTTNGNGRNGHVSLAREEYDALTGREELLSELQNTNAKMQLRNIDLASTVDAQAKQLSLYELQVSNLERIDGLQRALIDSLKDSEKAAGIAELSEFWRQWTIATSNAVDTRKVEREEIAKFEPDLFKMWRNWINDAGKRGRTLNFAGTRSEVEATMPETQTMMQAHLLAHRNAENAKLRDRVKQLEAELGALAKPEAQ
jgi:hypothetical protein